jgi:hypothetical protein
MNLNDLVNNVFKIDENVSDATYILYVNGKEATKYNDEIAAKMDVRLLKKKFPSKRFEIRQVTCTTQTVESKGEHSKSSITDPEILSVIKFAKNHYPGSQSDEEALDKFIIHSLRHGEKDDLRQDSEISSQDAQINTLSSEIDKLRSVIHSLKNKPASENLKNTKENQCWKNYKRVGVKKKNGKTVPNCVPVSEDVQNQMSSFIRLLESKNIRK